MTREDLVLLFLASAVAAIFAWCGALFLAWIIEGIAVLAREIVKAIREKRNKGLGGHY